MQHTLVQGWQAAVVAGVVVMSSSGSLAQAPAERSGSTPPNPASAREGAISRDEIMRRLHRPVDAEFAGQPMSDVVRFLALQADLTLQPLWRDDRHDLGLDPSMPVHIDASGLTVLQTLQVLLEHAGETGELPGGATWQISPQNRVKFGPRERLNRAEARRVEVYDVQDLALDPLPPAPVPRLNIEAALGSRGGNPGSPIEVESGGFWPAQSPDSVDSRADDLISLITATIEPERWVLNGGDAATIRYLDGSLVVLAPDYVHRQLQGIMHTNKD